MSINKKLQAYKGRKVEIWTPEGADFTLEFREPSGAFAAKMARDSKKKKIDVDEVTQGFELMSEVVYIDGEKAFENGAQVEEYFGDKGPGGAVMMNEMMRRSALVVGMKQEDIEQAVKN